MRKSKHFRKDVILARVIFAILCLVIIVVISMGVSALKNALNSGNTDEEPQTQQYDIPEFEDTEEVTEIEEVIDEIVVYAKTTAKVNMRVEPNTNCAVLASVPAATKMSMIEEVDGWYKVVYEEKEGYIRADYIELVEEVVISGAEVDTQE
ncbi:MAG: SH3 domain-containing protein [Agathobacter sp.]|nr:SH3 domain-containing protein [Agathobacter sp.]